MSHKATLTLLVILVLILTASTTFFATLHFQKDSPDCMVLEEQYVGLPEESADQVLEPQQTIQTMPAKQVANVKSPNNIITDEDLQELRKVLEQQLPDYVAHVQPNYTIEIGRQNGRYINATLYKDGKFLPSFPSFYAYLSKEQGWQLIFSGQEAPPCSKVNALKFPKDIAVECYPDL